jgi:hypothetical protein
MTERDAETMQTLREFQAYAQECSAQMLMNALYIQKELATVQMTDELRQRTVELCSTLIGTKHDLVTEILELDERLEAGAGNVEVLRRIDRMVQWAGEDAQKMHEVVMALDAELQKGVKDGGAYLLVSESAVNILTPLKQMRRLAERLREVLA